MVDDDHSEVDNNDCSFYYVYLQDLSDFDCDVALSCNVVYRLFTVHIQMQIMRHDI